MDLHVHKIITEISQLLSTVARLQHPERAAEFNRHGVYKISHAHHPITKWIPEAKPNWDWTVEMAGALHDEWKRRYKHPEEKIHNSYRVVTYLRDNPPTKFLLDTDERTPFKDCVGEYLVEGDTVASYRNYYMSPAKQRIACWNYSEMPSWYVIDPEHFGKFFEEQKQARLEKKLKREAVQKGYISNTTTENEVEKLPAKRRGRPPANKKPTPERKTPQIKGVNDFKIPPKKIALTKSVNSVGIHQRFHAIGTKTIAWLFNL